MLTVLNTVALVVAHTLKHFIVNFLVLNIYFNSNAANISSNSEPNNYNTTLKIMI